LACRAVERPVFSVFFWHLPAKKGTLLRTHTRSTANPKPECDARRRHFTLGVTVSLPWLMVIAAPVPQPALAMEGAVNPGASFAVPMPSLRFGGSPVPQRTQTDSPPAPALGETAPQNEAPRPPRHLPSASRARMHACGLEWQKAKETGQAADKTWFEFAQVCLAK
jgi:hypothetical protein